MTCSSRWTSTRADWGYRAASMCAVTRLGCRDRPVPVTARDLERFACDFGGLADSDLGELRNPEAGRLTSRPAKMIFIPSNLSRTRGSLRKMECRRWRA